MPDSKRFQRFLCVYLLIGIVIFPFYLYAQQEKAAPKEEPIFYTIQKGDTLWDISRRFYGAPQVWPDLWGRNSDVPILNPHLIYPGQRIRIQRQIALPRAEKPEVIPFVPPPQQPSEVAFVQPETQKPAPSLYNFSLIDQVGFIRIDPQKPIGTILKVRDDKNMISKGDIIYIKETADTDTHLDIGKRYTIYRILKPLREEKTKKLIGSQHVIQGIVEITEKEPQLVLGRVLESIRPIALGDMVMPYTDRSPKITLTPSPKDIHGKIILAEEHNNLIGPNMVAFIDKGSVDGIAIGQQYAIYYQDKVQIDPKTREKTLTLPVDIASLIVLHTEETTSTVVITNSIKHFSPGTNFHSPK